MRVYFAGKIGPTDWRTKLFGSRAGATSGCGTHDQDELLDPTYVWDLGGGLIYGGPFFISDDHGCAHFKMSHGVGANSLEAQNPFTDVDEDELFVCGNTVTTTAGKGITRSQIHAINNDRIRRSDWVFANIDSFTAYGTFFEIGYAVAHAIPVALNISPSLTDHGNPSELWYLKMAAKESYFENVENAFAKFTLKRGVRWPKSDTKK